MTKSSLSTTMTIGDEDIFLDIDYTYSPGHPGTAPSLTYPGDPPEGPEVEVVSIVWAKAKPRQVFVRVDDPERPGVQKIIANPLKPRPSDEWHALDAGPLFELVAGQTWLYDEICAAEEDFGPDPDDMRDSLRDGD